MPLVPLWSGLILNIVKLYNHPTDNNAPVENWFRIVKYSVFDGKFNIKAQILFDRYIQIFKRELLHLDLDLRL